MVYRFVIDLAPKSKKNSRPIFRNKKTGKVFIGKSSKLTEYENAVLLILTSQKNRYGLAQPLECKCRLDLVFEMKTTLRLDADNAILGVSDALQAAGVILNDKLFKRGSWDTVEETGKPDRIIAVVTPI